MIGTNDIVCPHGKDLSDGNGCNGINITREDGSVTNCMGVCTTPKENIYSSHIEGVDIIGATVTGALWDRNGFLRIVVIEKGDEKYDLMVEEGDQEGEGSAISLQLINNNFVGRAKPIKGTEMMRYLDDEEKEAEGDYDD